MSPPRSDLTDKRIVSMLTIAIGEILRYDRSVYSIGTHSLVCLMSFTESRIMMYTMTKLMKEIIMKKRNDWSFFPFLPIHMRTEFMSAASRFRKICTKHIENITVFPLSWHPLSRAPLLSSKYGKIKFDAMFTSFAPNSVGKINAIMSSNWFFVARMRKVF